MWNGGVDGGGLTARKNGGASSGLYHKSVRKHESCKHTIEVVEFGAGVRMAGPSGREKTWPNGKMSHYVTPYRATEDSTGTYTSAEEGANQSMVFYIITPLPIN